MNDTEMNVETAERELHELLDGVMANLLKDFAKATSVENIEREVGCISQQLKTLEKIKRLLGKAEEWESTTLIAQLTAVGEALNMITEQTSQYETISTEIQQNLAAQSRMMDGISTQLGTIATALDIMQQHVDLQNTAFETQVARITKTLDDMDRHVRGQFAAQEQTTRRFARLNIATIAAAVLVIAALLGVHFIWKI